VSPSLETIALSPAESGCAASSPGSPRPFVLKGSRLPALSTREGRSVTNSFVRGTFPNTGRRRAWSSSSSASSWPRRAENVSPVGSGGFHLERYAGSICDFFGGATPSFGPSEERHSAVIADCREVAARTDRCSALDYLEIANEPARRREADRCHVIKRDPEIWIASLPRQHASEPAPDKHGVIPDDQASVVSAQGRRRHRQSVRGSRDIPEHWPRRGYGQRDSSRRRSHAAKGRYANRTYRPSAKKIAPRKTPYLGRDRTAIKQPKSGDDAT
jgi:hypothetical protein